jgi:hypothetical protein
MGTCIVSIFQYISNKMQHYTLYFIWKLLYIFRLVPSPIIRRANKCIYSIWYLSHRYCYLPLSLISTIAADINNGVTNTRCCRYSCLPVHHPQHTQTSSNSSTIAAGSSNGVTNTRYCKFSCLPVNHSHHIQTSSNSSTIRSEERRVGTECGHR